jgi:hypothetical protein
MKQSYDRRTCLVSNKSPSPKINGHTTDIFGRKPLQTVVFDNTKDITYGFFIDKWFPKKNLKHDLWQENMYGVKNMSIPSKIDGIQSTFLAKKTCHKRPFSVTMKVNTYKFFNKTWSPLLI